MGCNMPDSHNTVKHIYSCQTLACRPVGCDTAKMENLRALRKAKSLSQAQLADMVGLNQGYISKLEKGDSNVTLDVIRSIARSLHVEPWQLFGTTSLQDRALAAINAIDPERAEAALVVLEAMARR